MIFEEVIGDLFTSPVNASLAHCVSRDFVMGKGIALTFLRRYGCRELLKRQNRSVGQVAHIDQGPSRTIFYMITKERYYNKPTYENLVRCLNDLANLCRLHNIRHLCMPRIGCGLDRLKWDMVKEYIKEAFKDLDVKITVYRLK